MHTPVLSLKRLLCSSAANQAVFELQPVQILHRTIRQTCEAGRLAFMLSSRIWPIIVAVCTGCYASGRVPSCSTFPPPASTMLLSVVGWRPKLRSRDSILLSDSLASTGSDFFDPIPACCDAGRTWLAFWLMVSELDRARADRFAKTA